MIDPNTRTDYGKMKKLLQFDKLDGERKGIIRKIAEEEQIVTQLYESFSAYQIPKGRDIPKSSVLLWHVDHQGNSWLQAHFGHSEQ